MKNLLLITYHFPPIGGSGVQRMTKLARYLPESGWRCHVVCGGHQHYPLLDESLLKDVSGDITVHRTLGFEPGAVATGLGCRLRARKWGTAWGAKFEDRFCWRLERIVGHLRLPETEMLWIPAAHERARKIIDRHPIEAVLTSGPPNVSHLVGMLLKRRTGLPWIADLRDPLVGNWAGSDSSAWDALMRRWLEAGIARHADAIVATAPEALEDLNRRHRQLPASRCRWIANGFDREDTPPEPLQSDERSEQFKVAYVGAFYREQSIQPILEAARLVRSEDAAAARQLKLRVIGSIAASQRSLIRPEDSEFFTDCGYQPHAASIREMAAADVLLLLTPPTPGGRFCIPAKVFEYLAFGGRVLAIVHPDTELERILASAGNVTVLRDRSPEALAQAIQNCFDRWKIGAPPQPRRLDSLSQFERRSIAGQYADLINRTIDSPRRSRLRLVTAPSACEVPA